MELYIFNKTLEFKGVLDIFFSLRWIRRYYKSGEFELQCALTSENLKLLQREYIIYKLGNREAAYIEYRNLKQDADGKEILIVRGKFLTGYLNRRIIWGTETINNTAENAMRNLVNHNCIDTKNSARKINNLMLGNLNNFTPSINYQVSYKNLLEELENLSYLSNLGYKINLNINNKKLIFEVYKGLDRSINQNINSKAIFSKEFDNILEQEYVDSLNNYRNMVVVGGIGEGTEKKLATLGETSGLDRYETFVDASDINNEVDEVILSDEDYTNLLIERGKSILVETKKIQTFDSIINLNSNLKYKVDFDLGDIVTFISKKWSLTLNTRITEIEEVYEQNGLSVNITFGYNIPTIIDKIKQVVK